MVGLPGENITRVTQGKGTVTQDKFNLGRYRYPGKVTHGRVTKSKINQGIITKVIDVI